jgi:hypothetical protein
MKDVLFDNEMSLSKWTSFIRGQSKRTYVLSDNELSLFVTPRRYLFLSVSLSLTLSERERQREQKGDGQQEMCVC